MAELYVYYRIDPAQGEAAHAQVEGQQAWLRTGIDGLQTGLLLRADAVPRGAEATWMEIYRRPGGLDAAACALIEAAMQALPTGRVGPRIVERFEPLGYNAAAAPVS